MAGGVHMTAETAALLGVPLALFEQRLVDVKGACGVARRLLLRAHMQPSYTGRGKMDTFLLDASGANADVVRRHLGPPLPLRAV